MPSTYMGGGINWTWFLEVEHVTADSVKIVRHFRLHDERNAAEIAALTVVGSFRIIENNPGRFADKVELTERTGRDGNERMTDTLTVVNSRRIFDYADYGEAPRD